MIRLTRCLAVALVLSSAPASAAVIERTLSYSLGPTSGTFGDGQTLSGIGTFFNDDPFEFGLGDRLVFNVMFDHPLQVFDFGEPTDEYFSFGLGTTPGSPGFSGTWISSIEAIGSHGDVWAGPITLAWIGGGGGFGWGGHGVNVTDHMGIFSGIRWITELTSAKEGVPMTIASFTGVQMGADGIRVLPVPEPVLLTQLAIAVLAVVSRQRWARRR